MLDQTFADHGWPWGGGPGQQNLADLIFLQADPLGNRTLGEIQGCGGPVEPTRPNHHGQGLKKFVIQHKQMFSDVFKTCLKSPSPPPLTALMMESYISKINIICM
jgi:hypothetical protein